MSQGKNYYQILQVDPHAEYEIITAAYKRLSIKYHPDTNHSDDATLRMQQINQAYQILKDPASRADYDRTLEKDLSNEDNNQSNRDHWDNTAAPNADNPTSAPAIRPQYILANFIASLSFPVTYVMMVFLLFRFFRSPNIIITLIVIVISGIIAYKVSARVERHFRLRR